MLLQSVAYQKVTSKYLFYVARYSVRIHYSVSYWIVFSSDVVCLYSNQYISANVTTNAISMIYISKSASVDCRSEWSVERYCGRWV